MGRNGEPAPDELGGEETERRPPSTPRRYRRLLERDLILGGFAILFVVGGGLVWLLYGSGAFAGTWLCLGAGAVMLAVLVVVFRRAG